jgi:hypothetical protein
VEVEQVDVGVGPFMMITVWWLTRLWRIVEPVLKA